MITKYTKEQMEAAFEMVKPEMHWKARIDKKLMDVSPEQVDIIRYAITYFTGSVATVKQYKNGNAHFRAAGYWVTCG